MKTVGAFEAKNHLSSLLAEVKNGAKIAITKHGVKVAYLVPVEEEEQSEPVVNAMEILRNLRQHCKLGDDLSINDLKTEGRR